MQDTNFVEIWDVLNCEHPIITHNCHEITKRDLDGDVPNSNKVNKVALKMFIKQIKSD